MKKLLKHIRTFAIVSLLILLMTSTSFASPLINVVSPDEAVNIALFYYCLNVAEQDDVEINNYAVTPLYDEEGKVTYYAVDFFEDEQGIGYALVGANLTYYQCPEYYLEGSSYYYLNALEGNETVYYNPWQVYSHEDGKYVDLYNQEVDTAEVEDGVVFDGELFENRIVLQNVSEVGDPLEDARVFAIHPSVYLQNLGYTNVSTDSYGTIETAMDNAGAFNYMYSVPKTLSTGTVLRYGGHCVLTAVSNVLKYWKYKYCGNYPSGYQTIFSDVLNKAVSSGMFSNVTNGSGVSKGNIGPLINAVNTQYGYSGRFYVNSESSTTFLKNYINLGWPIILTFTTDLPSSSPFPYSSHATVAFGYNVMNAYIESELSQYTFVKFFDAHSSRGKVYVCWNMIRNSEYYLEEPITTHMVAFCPYT